MSASRSATLTIRVSGQARDLIRLPKTIQPPKGLLLFDGQPLALGSLSQGLGGAIEC